ncbi:hypothetical protein ACFYVR_24840 [Rhodococcus sp. NPDC003318]|uniref:hypothetical protein n=1 Tax=Rhodococcus sp. NPDC003318 TaxID=3364503 RepID=UPI0036AB4B34
MMADPPLAHPAETSKVDLLFFDTTSTYFELAEPDEPVARNDAGRRLGDGPDHGRSRP